MSWYSNLSVKQKILFFFILMAVTNFGIISYVDISLAEYEAAHNIHELDYIIRLLIFLAVIILLLAFIGAAFIKKYILEPIKEINIKTKQLTVGNIKTDLEPIEWKDEIGELNTNFRKVLNRLNDIANLSEAVAKGDLSKNLEIESDEDLLSQSINHMIQKFKDINSEVSQEINQLASTASELNSVIAQFSSSIAETSSSISETTSTVEEVKKTSEVSNKKAKEAVEAMDEMKEIADSGKESVSDTLNGVQLIKEQMAAIGQNIIKLTEFSQSISEIIDSVNDIAEQSNLLAVNASIEAARAGEQGKSFVIVAQEIKNLADKSKQATGKVKTLLNDIQNSINSAVMATEKGEKIALEQSTVASKSGEAIDELARTMDAVRDIVLQSSLTIQEQFIGMEQITVAMENINSASQQNSVGAKQLQETTVMLKDIGSKLKEIISQLRL